MKNNSDYLEPCCCSNRPGPTIRMWVAVIALVSVALFFWESARVFALDEGVIENHASEQQDQLLQDIDGGIVVDHTITMIAHEFYQHFVKFWREQPAFSAHNLTVYERPTARWGSIVWIEHKNIIIFRANLFSARSKTEAIAEMAAKNINQQLEQIELQDLLFDDPDLTKEGY